MNTTLLLEFKNATIDTSGRKTFISGVFLEADVVNRNKRYYPSAVLEHAVSSISSDIRNGRFLGQLGHPSDLTTDPSKISHVITSLERKGNQWIGKARLIDEGAGKVAKAIISAGASLGVSSRGTGQLKQGHGHTIVENYDLLAVDIVSNPSAPHAYVSALSESMRNPKLSLLEQTVALDILQGIPDIGDLLASLQARNGIDFDNGPGNQLPGHQGFTSVNDQRTYLEWLMADRDELLRKLADMQTVIDQTGLAKSKTTYSQARSQSTDPFTVAAINKELQNESHSRAVRDYTKQLLGRAARRNNFTPNDNLDQATDGLRKRTQFR
jgi:Prohead core protein serine protease